MKYQPPSRLENQCGCSAMTPSNATIVITMAYAGANIAASR